MSQAQIPDGSVTQQNEVPSKGHRLHEFELTGALGRVIRLSDFRGRANLVLIASDDRPETAKLMADIASRYSEIKNGEAEVLAIVHSSRESLPKSSRNRICLTPFWRDRICLTPFWRGRQWTAPPQARRRRFEGA